MRHILLFKTVKSEFLDFCIDKCRDHFADASIVLISQKEPSLGAFTAKVKNIIIVNGGMISESSMTDDVKKELPHNESFAAVIPLYNSDLGYYRGVWRAAILSGASKVFGLRLDGRFVRFTRISFAARHLFNSYVVRIAASILIAPYAIWLFCKNSLRLKLNNSFRPTQ